WNRTNDQRINSPTLYRWATGEHGGLRRRRRILRKAPRIVKEPRHRGRGRPLPPSAPGQPPARGHRHLHALAQHLGPKIGDPFDKSAGDLVPAWDEQGSQVSPHVLHDDHADRNRPEGHLAGLGHAGTGAELPRESFDEVRTEPHGSRPQALDGYLGSV